MLLRDFATTIKIDSAKLIRYALNPDHPHGRHKARVFAAALGFTTNNYQQLLNQIEAKALSANAVLKQTDHFGQHLQVDLPIQGVEGQIVTVRTGWLVASDSNTAFLTTTFVL